jgi:hypothetical protein
MPKDDRGTISTFFFARRNSREFGIWFHGQRFTAGTGIKVKLMDKSSEDCAKRRFID